MSGSKLKVASSRWSLVCQSLGAAAWFLSLQCGLGETAAAENATPLGWTVSWGETNFVAHGVWGRMILLTNTHWLCVSTRFSRTNSVLQLQTSTNTARSWTWISEVAKGTRLLDNGELMQLADGTVLLTCRSLIEGQSYHLPVYRSTDAGQSWSAWSMIDANEGAPGTLKKRGLWEPHFYSLTDGRLAVAYANEKHASAKPAFSQVCSVKISSDSGRTWGDEITLAAEPGGGELRPGMPVVVRMRDGRYLAVYEIVGVGDADVFYKVSDDGVHWPTGLGTRIEGHHAGPWVTSLSSGRLLLTSCANTLSCSDDFGRTWHPADPPAWDFGPGKRFTWPAVYQTGSREIAAMISLGGVKMRFGTLHERGKQATPAGKE